MSVLFICQEYQLNVPRSTRVKALTENASEQDVNVLFYASSKAETNKHSFIKLEVPFLLKYTLFRDFCNCRSRYIVINKMIGLLVRLFSTFIKVDKWEILHSHTLRAIDFTQYSHIVLSVAPFSNYLLAQKIRKKSTDGRLILDIGDPLSLNPGLDKGIKVNLNTYEADALKVANGLIVTNLNTSLFYKDTFKFNRNLLILPNGYKLSSGMFPAEVSISFDNIKAIYAGALYEKLRPINPLLGAFQKLGNDGHLEVVTDNEPVIRSGNIKWEKRLPQDELFAHYLGVNLLIYIDNNQGIQTSSKIYELLALGSPILFIYTFQSENYHFARNFGWVHFVHNDEELIYKYLTENILGKKLEYRPDYGVIKQFEWQEFKDRYFKFIENLDSNIERV